MRINPKFCKGVVIAHGKSEFLLAEHIKSNLHLPIEIYANKNGVNEHTNRWLNEYIRK